MLTLEHIKLLGPKAQQFEMGTGGTPEITFQEVADAMSGLSQIASRYARFKYAHDVSSYGFIKKSLRVYALKRSKLPMTTHYWDALIDMAIEFHAHNVVFSVGRKARRAGRRRWSRADEDRFMVVLSVLDNAEYDLRRAFREWNELQIQSHAYT